jgi:transposase-like protein
MISFKGSHYPKNIILYAVFFYVRYAVSYRDLEKVIAERGVKIDHLTLNRWVMKYAPMISSEATCYVRRIIVSKNKTLLCLNKIRDRTQLCKSGKLGGCASGYL